MISNKEYANLVIGAGVYGESMRGYLEKDTLYADQTSVGVIQFEKPRLRTRFCYGWVLYCFLIKFKSLKFTNNFFR